MPKKKIIILLILMIILNILFSIIPLNVPPLDSRIGYGLNDVAEWTSSDDLYNYEGYFFTLDLIYPIVYAFFFYFIMKLRKLKFLFLPFIVAGFDYLENLGFLIVINMPFSQGFAMFIALISLLKWISLGLLTLVLFEALVKSIWNKHTGG